jgi:hypothetical protein
MTRRTVYLAGPITGCTKGEANDWRDVACARLADFGITGISPLRCEPIVGERYGVGYPDPRFGVPSAIAAKNRFDVENCDMMLAYFPPEEIPTWWERVFYRIDNVGPQDVPYKWPSAGTIWEIGMAHMARKQAVVVCENTILFKHPVIQTAPWTLTSLDEGLDVVIGVLQDYAQGNATERGRR